MLPPRRGPPSSPPACRSGGELEDRVGVVTLDRVQREPGWIAVPASQRLHRPAVERHALFVRQRVVNRPLSKFVAKLQDAAVYLEDAVLDALRESRAGTSADLLRERGLEPWSKHRCDLKERLRAATEPRGACKDGITDRRRNLVVVSCDRFGDEERVAARRAMQSRRIEVARSSNRADCLEGQRRYPNLGGERSREVAEREPQRVCASNLLVTKRSDDKDRHVPEPPTDHTEHVERALVRPMEILEDDHRRRPPRLAKQCEKRREHLIAIGRIERCAKRTLDLVGDVRQRRERPTRRSRIAPAPQRLDTFAEICAERLDERRLAHAGLPGDEHEPAGATARSCH